MSTLPYRSIEDTSEDHALLTNEDGYDVAILRRLEGYESELDNVEWQQLLDFLNAAPAMLDILTEIIDGDDLSGLIKSVEKAKRLLHPNSHE